MIGRLSFGMLCLAAASATLGQNVRPAAGETSGPRLIAKTEGRKILAAIPAVDADVDSETDCSHLVHDIYEQAGFPYDYVTSRELYTGSANFTRVRAPQAGDLVVWRGHVGIVTDAKRHSFFSFVRSGPDTQFYDSPYWRARGTARFFRYINEKPLQVDRALETADRSDDQSQVDSSGPQTPGKLSRPARARELRPAPAAEVIRPATEAPRESVFLVAGKNPSPEEVAAAFAEMNQETGESLRTHSLNSPGKSVVVYRELRVSAVQIKGKRGTAVVQIESLGASADTQTDSQARWREQPLEFEKTKRGWAMRRVEGIAYVKREVALQALSARLAELARNTDTTSEQEREQRQIVRFLNLLVAENPIAASADNN